LRMERASQNALALARHLETLPAVRRVYYPGLASHPDADHAARLLSRGFGAIVSMSLQGGYEAVQAMVTRLKMVKFVPSLGDVSTTLSHPVVASHRELTAEEKVRVGIDPSVVRISVGIEGLAAILADFTEALTTGV
ncbi:MAG: PLP-dependent transferase, partial [Firmicutes bacterium]|nr:PLP-dependent transferase [Bacillota bacterium]